MGERLTKYFSLPVYPYLYGLVFIAYKSSRYFPSFDLLTAISFYVLFYVSTYFLTRLLSKNNNAVYVPLQVMIIWISVLNVSMLAQSFGYNYSYIPTGFYFSFYLCVVLIVSCFYFLKKKVQFPVELNRFVNSFLCILFFIFIINGLARNQGKKELAQNRNTHPFQNFRMQATQQPDIVWILMDEYGSSSQLQKEFGFANPLDSILRKKNFYLADTIKTHFTSTLFSVCSIFDFDKKETASSYYSCATLLKESKWAAVMERSGYRFVNLSAFDIGGENKLDNRSGYPQTYTDQLFMGTIFSVIDSEIKYSQAKCDAFNQKVYRILDSTLSVKNTKPQFIWAHFGIPHAPFSRNADGDYLPEEKFSETDTAQIKKKYTGYVLYGNKLLLSILAKHPELNEKIVIISGDHGPRYPIFRTNISFYPFAAIHMPGQYDSSALQHINYISQLPGFIMQHLAK